MYKLSTLANGLRIIEVPVKSAKAFSILVMVKTGSAHETKQTNGLSHFVEHMFFKGTTKRPDTLAISSALDSVGGEFNAFTSKEYTGYYAKVGNQHAPVAVDVISDMLLNSTFDTKEIERERGVILEEINMYENNPLMHIDELFERCLYGDTPAGWDTIGTKQNIASFQRKDFVEYIGSQYRGASVIVGMAGAFTNAQVATVRALFGRLAKGTVAPAFHHEDTQTAPALIVKKQNTKQVTFSVGVRAYSYHHDDFYAANLLATILGGSMSSRLFISVRERQGLAYQVHTSVEGYADSGYLTTDVGTSADKLMDALRTILSEYHRTTHELVAIKELQRAKDYLKGKTTLQLEAAEHLNSWYVRQMLLQRTVRSPKQLFALIDGISRQDIRRVARDIFTNAKLNMAAIGSGIDEKVLRQELELKS